MGAVAKDQWIDLDRDSRIESAKTLTCNSKSSEQIAAILQTAQKSAKPQLLMRLAPDKAEALIGINMGYDTVSEATIFGAATSEPVQTGITILAAGTSDIPIAIEAQRTLGFHGALAQITANVGVAGVWRVTKEIGALWQHRILIVVAGMEDALFSVLAGHGVAETGQLALFAAPGRCPTRLGVVNIGNGLGEACTTLQMRAVR